MGFVYDRILKRMKESFYDVACKTINFALRSRGLQMDSNEMEFLNKELDQAVDNIASELGLKESVKTAVEEKKFEVDEVVQVVKIGRRRRY